MADGQRTVALGLFRLLATHITLWHQIGATLWNAPLGRTPAVNALLQKDRDSVRGMIDRIGSTCSAMKEPVPADMQRFLPLSSLKYSSAEWGREPSIQLIKDGHHQIINDIDFLETVYSSEEIDIVEQFLQRLRSNHIHWLERLMNEA